MPQQDPFDAVLARRGAHVQKLETLNGRLLVALHDGTSDAELDRLISEQRDVVDAIAKATEDLFAVATGRGLLPVTIG